MADDVDNGTGPLARLPKRESRAGQVDVAEDLQVPRLAPDEFYTRGSRHLCG